MEKVTGNNHPEAATAVPNIGTIAVFAIKSDYETLPTHQLPEIDGLSDEQYLEVSRKFGDRYVRLVSGFDRAESQDALGLSAETEIKPLIEKIHNLDNVAVSRFMVGGYRRALNDFYFRHGSEPQFSEQAPSDEDMAHVKQVSRGPFGTPILYTDGHNEELFGYKSLSFASPELMVENELPPLVVVYDGYGELERQKVTIHESSHVVFSLLRRVGAIPSPYGEGVTIAGEKSAFELARDEAVAQMAANQNGFQHPNVVKLMSVGNYSEAEITEYREACLQLPRVFVESVGLKFSDLILGVMHSRNFSEMVSNLGRMKQIMGSRQVAVRPVEHATQKSDPSVPSGWGLA